MSNREPLHIIKAFSAASILFYETKENIIYQNSK